MGRKGQREKDKKYGCYFICSCEGKKVSVCALSRGSSLCKGLSQEAAGAECQREGKDKSHRIAQVNVRTLDLTLCKGEASRGFC